MNNYYFRCASLAVLFTVMTVCAQQQESVPVHFVDKKPPRYEYGYIVADAEGSAQGHVHTRDGMYTLGRYYVSLPNGSAQKVTYFADHLGYHPLVSYESSSTKGSSRAQFAMGQKAVAALSNAPETPAVHANVIPTTPRTPTTTTNQPLVSPTRGPKFESSFTTPGNSISAFTTKNFGGSTAAPGVGGRHSKLLSKPSTIEPFVHSTPSGFTSGRLDEERPPPVHGFGHSTSQGFDFSQGRFSPQQEFVHSTPMTPRPESERFSNFQEGPSTARFVHSSTTAAPLFELGGLPTGPSTILPVVHTTPSEPPRFLTEQEKEIQLISGLDQVLQFATDHIDQDLAKNGNGSFVFSDIGNITSFAGVGQDDTEQASSGKLSSKQQPLSPNSYEDEIQRVKQQLNEQQRVYAERLQALSATTVRASTTTTTTMRPIVVAEDNRFRSEVEQLNGLGSLNSITTTNHGERGLNSVQKPSPFREEVSSTPRTTDSASQSSNAVPINQPSNSIADAGVNNQLAALQAGISILSSENAKPVKENSIEIDSGTYTTVVDIQRGISLDVQHNPDGSISLSSNFGQRLANQGQPQRFQGLAYERRLVDPQAQEIARETDPILRQQKQQEFLLRQEAEIREVEKSIDALQQQIITQIDREHEQEQEKQEKRKQEQEERESHLDNVEDDTMTETVSKGLTKSKATEVTIENIPGRLVISTDVDLPNEIPAQFDPAVQLIDRGTVADDQVEALPQRTVKSQNLAGVLTLHGRNNAAVVGQEPHKLHLPGVRGHVGTSQKLTFRSGNNVLPSAETIVVQQGPQKLPVNYPIGQKQVPPLTAAQSVSKPVLLEPFRLETKGNLLPASPSPTLFPVKLEAPSGVQPTKIIDVEKPPKEVTKVVEVEKPVPVLQPFPVEVTKFVHVDRPVPVPQPVPVSHAVPVPVAVPQAVGVPVPHLIPVPEILPVTLKEYYPVFVHKDNKDGSKPGQQEDHPAEPVHNSNIHIYGDDLKGGVKEIFLHSFKSQLPEGMIIQEQIQPEIAHMIEFDGNTFKHDFDLQSLINHHMIRPHHGVPEDPNQLSGALKQRFQIKNALKNLKLEYGFKPPLRPSVQLTEEVKPSIFGPSVRS